jgi:hypothetical protein
MMGIKNFIMRIAVAVWLVFSFAMCAKKVNKVETPASTTVATPANTATNNADVANIGADTSLVILAAYVPPFPPVASFTIDPADWSFDGTDVPAGSIIYIPAGTRGSLLLKNIKGTASRPIVIINQGGSVTITTALTASYALKTQNCQYFKILGNGDDDFKYGITLNGGNIGLTLDDLSFDFEISALEVRNCGFAGIMAKTDPTCDVATQRGHFIMRNVRIHHNYVHKTGGEGLYIGNSFYANGVSLACGTVFPHDVTDAKIYNNRIDSTGCEGIQVGSATVNCIVCRNSVKNPGLSPFASGQNNGIQIGEGTGGKCFSNFVKNAPGNGIIVLGLGGNLLYDNIIVNTGGHGIFADSRYTPGAFFQFINNTIVNPGMDGIKLNSEIIPMNTVINNVIIIPGTGIAINRKNLLVKLTTINNYIGKDINACKFVNAEANNFHLLPGSPLINAGVDVSLYGIDVDYYGDERPSDAAFDIGATEYQ